MDISFKEVLIVLGSFAGTIAGSVLYLIKLGGRVENVEKEQIVNLASIKKLEARTNILEIKEAVSNKVLETMGEDIKTIKDFITHGGKDEFKKDLIKTIKETIREIR